MSRDPFAHQEIHASAGSGKTHQLTNRYLLLLAEGVEPDAILATTFTRKAAGEILDRVLDRLAAAAGDAGKGRELVAQLEAPKDSPPDFAALLRWMVRSLHRVRIGTLDSFYLALAGSFSLELGLPAGWSICEQADDDALQRDALERLLDQQPEDIGNLLPLLSKGETKRSVQGELQEIIGAHYDVFRSSERSAWERLQAPEPVGAAQKTAALERLRGFDYSACGHKGFFKARDNDVANFEQEKWQDFVGGGLAAKVLAGETTYFKKQIPQDAQEFYETLLQHARSQILGRLAEQTRATWDLLDRFHRELWALKQATGALRFGDVTQALVEALQGQALRAETLAFRLDGAIEHLLLDEFQDTSLPQWRALLPIAQRIVQAAAEPPRSFFCVGDDKQAIYGWRGGMAEIFQTLLHSLGPLKQVPLFESRRSAPPIIDGVNQVFGNLKQFQAGDKRQDGLDAWSKRFEQHTTFKKEIRGYVRLHTGPAQQDGQQVGDQRRRHCEYVATKIRDLVAQAPGHSVGVLCRKNDAVARMIYELRQLRVPASEEGGNPLTDSPAVELILSLFTLADHPGHSVAWFHLQNSALQRHLQACAEVQASSVRRDLLTMGCGLFVYTWAKLLAPACDMRDLSRLQQLMEMAYGYQSRSTLRADDFVAWVRGQRVLDPDATAQVRVMTIHAAKGLEFDVVVLPELEAGVTGQTPTFVVGRDPNSLEVNFVCRYADDAVQKLLAPEERGAFEQDRRRRVEESLSLLYVAMTRAIHALHLFIPGPRDRNQKDAWYNLLRQTLAPEAAWTENALLYEHGDANWFERSAAAAAVAVAPPPERPVRITFLPVQTERRRGLERVAPSSREDQAQVALKGQFHPSAGTGPAAGTLYHAWFALIDWLDGREFTDDELRKAAEKERVKLTKEQAKLTAEVWRDLDGLMDRFRSYLQKPEVGAVLRRSAYASPEQPGFPAALKRFWTNSLAPQQVEMERRFLVRDGATFWNGSLDRVVWLGDGDRTVAADVIDYKTDDIAPGDEAALAARTEHYRPQLDAYRRVAARLAGLAEERVATRLVFTSPGRVVAL
jgi:ATP-dependent helicase/nuclease subunit A